MCYALFQGDPHIYKIGADAYSCMVRELGKINQCIIVSGESGAGKVSCLGQPDLTVCMLGNFSCFCCGLLTSFQNLLFSIQLFIKLNTIRVSKGFNPDQQTKIADKMAAVYKCLLS